MPRSMKLLVLAVLSTMLIVAACDNSEQTQTNAQPAANQGGHDHDHDHDHAHVAAWEAVKHAIVVLTPTEGNKAAGVLRFEESDEGVRITGEVTGLNPNQEHAMHAHEFGNVSSSDGTAAGGHYNPEGHDHALPNGAARHAGDFGNIEADANGVAKVDATFDNVTIAGLTNPLIGRSIIVHADPDDGGQPTGNAGARIAQGVIGIDKGQ